MSDFTVLHEGNAQANPLHAEIERMKRERDALADALKAYLRAGIGHSTNYQLQMRAWDMSHAALAQVRKCPTNATR